MNSLRNSVVLTYSQSCVGIFKEPGVPCDHGNYFSVILQDDADAMGDMPDNDKIRKIEEENLRYNVLNMWAENFVEAAKGLGPLDVITFQCEETGDRSIFILDKRIPDSYKMDRLFRGYGVRWRPVMVAEVESVTGLKFPRKADGSF